MFVQSPRVNPRLFVSFFSMSTLRKYVELGSYWMGLLESAVGRSESPFSLLPRGFPFWFRHDETSMHVVRIHGLALLRQNLMYANGAIEL